MPCKHYRDALIEVAASGSAPHVELRAHLSECASCRADFAEEQSLFQAIDSGLHPKANADIPPSLIPNVRARLDEAVIPRFRWVPSAVFAFSGMALALIGFLVVRPHPTAPEEFAKQRTIVVPSPTVAAAKGNPERVSSEGALAAVVRVGHSRASRNSTNPPSAASSNPEVLVPPDEREGLAKLVATLNEHADVAAALLAQRPEKKDTLITVDPLKISDIEIKTFDGTGTEASDGTGEKH